MPRQPRFGLLFSCLVLSTVGPVSGFDPVPELDRYVERTIEEWEVPGLSIAVVHQGVTVFARGYGVLETGKTEAVDEHTLFAIGSTTKAMTAATLALQVDAGRMDWNDPVQRYLPWFRLSDPWVSRELTVRDLLTHRAGLGNADLLWYGSDRSRREIMERVVRVPPAYSMRDGFIYQNLLYVAAGEVAAEVAGKSWEDLVEEEIHRPLGMDRTQPTLARARARDNVAQPHDRIHSEVVAIENASVDSVAPAGSVWSSVHDMSQWLNLLLAGGRWEGKQLLSEDSVAEMFRPQTLLDLRSIYPAVSLLEPHWTSYGLGWFQLDYQGRAVSFHTGSIDGMSAIAGLVPDEGLGVVVLANLDHAELRHALLWKAIDLWGGESNGRDWSGEFFTLYGDLETAAEEKRLETRDARIPSTTPSVTLEAYVGTYIDEVYDRLTVSLQGGDLHLRLGPEISGRLTHWHHDTFLLTFDRAWQRETLVGFALDSAGVPSRVEFFDQSFDRLQDTDLTTHQVPGTH